MSETTRTRRKGSKRNPLTISEPPEGGWNLSIEPSDCPLRHQHMEGPSGYLQWHNWAEREGKTHKQLRCAGCHRWTIWVPKSFSPAVSDA